MKDRIEHIDHLTIDQIKAFFEGKLDKREKFAIERHLLDCTLCSEALEGFENNPIHAKEDVEELKGLLTKRTQKESDSVFWRYKYYGIAASLALLIATVFLVFEINPVSDEDKIALKSESTLESAPSTEDPVLLNQHEEVELEFDETIIESEPDFVAVIESKVNDITISASGKEGVSDRAVALLSEAENLGAGAQASQGEMELEDVASFEDNAAFFDEELEEKVGEELSIVTLQASPQASEALQERLNSDAFKTVRTEALRSRLAVIDSNPDPQPQIGMAQYRVYLKENLLYPSVAKENSVGGDVELAFDIEANGSITNIQVTKSLGSGCDEEAIRLLTNGPGWFPARKNGIPAKGEAQIIIVFELSGQ